MKKNQPLRKPNQEIELKLALPTDDPITLAKRLAHTSVLARRKPTQLRFNNVYYDTPEEVLRQSRVALRIRRIDSDTNRQWVQTLKTGGSIDSALSQRGEWEVPVPSDALVLDALKATPWSKIDPDGTVFGALAPTFSTVFERTSWLVRRRDASVIAVTLDLGHITAGEKSTPICELEFELRAGHPAALFDLAQQIARTIAVLPVNMSKAERGYALTKNALNKPLRAQSPKLTKNLSLPEAAGHVLREMFSQFINNLNTLRTTDDPEVVHQARVGWRRFKSALRLFKPALAASVMPSWAALESLLKSLGELRDLDVACYETLPPLADTYIAGDAQRADAWQVMTQGLLQAVNLHRKSVRDALQDPSVGSALLSTTQWLEQLTAPNGQTNVGSDLKVSNQNWGWRRIIRLHRQLKIACKDSNNPDSQHRVRILAKRMRYGIESVQSWLPKQRAKRWYLQATDLQLSLGAARDLLQAAALVEKLDVDRGLAEFLRGLAAGQARLASHGRFTARIGASAWQDNLKG